LCNPAKTLAAGREGAGFAAPNQAGIRTISRVMPELELALLRRSVNELARGSERCARCGRSPLVGERVYRLASRACVCELCRALERSEPISSEIVHGPAFGHTMRIVDRRDEQPRAA
jgi:hypothetical protein